MQPLESNNLRESLDKRRRIVLPLSQRALIKLSNLGITVATAESCTGGLLSALLTEYPGSSAIYKGGVVAYDNQVKVRLLGVPTDILNQKGAVSEDIASAMARGSLDLIKSDLAIAITGIAGPGGGSPMKPVGLVYCHWAFKTPAVGRCFQGNSGAEMTIPGLKVKRSERFQDASNISYELLIQNEQGQIAPEDFRATIRWMTCEFVLGLLAQDVSS